MIPMQTIQDFLSVKTLALVGISRSGKKMGNAVFKALSENGYRVLLVHPAVSSIEGTACYPNLASLPEPVENLLMVVPPGQTELVLPEAHHAGISRVWMQQGSSSPAALDFCTRNGMTAIHGECILMHLPRADKIHRIHRWFRQLFGRMPR